MHLDYDDDHLREWAERIWAAFEYYGGSGGVTELRSIFSLVLPEPEWEYGTRRSVTDGWERGDTYGEHEYIDTRSISDNINEDRSSTRPGRDMSRAVRRRKAGPWLPVEN